MTAKEEGDYEASDRPARRGRGGRGEYRGRGEGRGRGEYRPRGEGRGRGEYRGRGGEYRERGEYRGEYRGGRGGRGRGRFRREEGDRPHTEGADEEVEGVEMEKPKVGEYDERHHGKHTYYSGKSREEWHPYDRKSGTGRGRYAKKEGFGRGGWGNERAIYKKKGELTPEREVSEERKEGEEGETHEGGDDKPRGERRERRERRDRREEEEKEEKEESEEEETGMTMEDFMKLKKEKQANIPKKLEGRKAESIKAKNLQQAEQTKTFAMTLENQLQDKDVYNVGAVKSKDNQLLGFGEAPDEEYYEERRGRRGRGRGGRGGRGRGGDYRRERRGGQATSMNQLGDEDFPTL